MAEKWKSILLLGLPGTGKSTLGRALAQLPEFVHAEAGRLFRSIAPDSPAGREVRPFLEKGTLIPADLAVRIWRDDVQRRADRGEYEPARQVLLLDGMPRTRAQAELLAGVTDILRVVYLDCDDESRLTGRLLRRGGTEGRADDADESVIRRRLDLHRREVLPLLEVYRTAVARIDACRDALDVLIDFTVAVREALRVGSP